MKILYRSINFQTDFLMNMAGSIRWCEVLYVYKVIWITV